MINLFKNGNWRRNISAAISKEKKINSNEKKTKFSIVNKELNFGTYFKNMEKSTKENSKKNSAKSKIDNYDTNDTIQEKSKNKLKKRKIQKKKINQCSNLRSKKRSLIKNNEFKKLKKNTKKKFNQFKTAYKKTLIKKIKNQIDFKHSGFENTIRSNQIFNFYNIKKHKKKEIKQKNKKSNMKYRKRRNLRI